MWILTATVRNLRGIDHAVHCRSKSGSIFSQIEQSVCHICAHNAPQGRFHTITVISEKDLQSVKTSSQKDFLSGVIISVPKMLQREDARRADKKQRQLCHKLMTS